MATEAGLGIALGLVNVESGAGMRGRLTVGAREVGVTGRRVVALGGRRVVRGALDGKVNEENDACD